MQRSSESHGSTVSSASLLAHAGLEGLLAAEARGDLQRLAAVLAQRREHVDQELLVGDRVSDLERRVPRGQQREVVLVEVGDGLRVVGLELGLGDLVDPRLDDLAEDLATRLPADRLGDDPDGVLRLDEAEWHLAAELGGARTDERGRLGPTTTGRSPHPDVASSGRSRSGNSCPRLRAADAGPGAGWTGSNHGAPVGCWLKLKSRTRSAEQRARLAHVGRGSGRPSVLRVEPLPAEEVVLDELVVGVVAEDLVVDEAVPGVGADHDARARAGRSPFWSTTGGTTWS